MVVGRQKGIIHLNALKPGVTNNVTSEQWAYIAGIVDGEGHISIRNKHHEINNWGVNVTQKDTRLLEWLTNVTGAGKIRIRETKSPMYPERKSTIGEWRVYRQREVYDVLVNIYPYMLVKPERAQQAISELEERFGFAPF